MDDSLYNNSKSARWSTRSARVLPLTAQLNIREVMAYIAAAALLYILMHRDAVHIKFATRSRARRSSSMPVPRDGQTIDNAETDATSRTLAETQATPTTTSSIGTEPKLPALSLRQADDAVLFNLFSGRMTMRDGGANATLLSACDELSAIVIREFLAMRPSFTRNMKKDLRGSNKLGELDSGFQMNNEFYKWQMGKRDKVYNACVEKKGKDDPKEVCERSMLEDEWPEVYNTQAFATLRAFIFESAAHTSVGKAVLTDLQTGNIAEKSDMDAWFSVQSPGMFHAEHNHHFSSIAGTLYLHTGDGSGRIVFLDPRMPHSVNEDMLEREMMKDAAGEDVTPKELYLFGNGRRGVSVEPRDGMLLLFPPWLFHKVEHTVAPKREQVSVGESVRESRSLIASLWWWISFGEWRERARLAKAERLARLRKEFARGRDPVWTTDFDVSGFRVAFSFNIGQSWNASVDLSVADADSERVYEMLRVNAVSPTRLEKEYWVYVDDDELRQSTVRFASAAHDVERNKL